MRLAIFHLGFFYSGGGERTVLNEALNLERRGHQVTVYAPIIRPERCFPDLLQRVDVRGYLPRVPIAIPMREAVSMMASSVLSPALASRFKQYDAFICHGQPSTWIGHIVGRILKKPYISYLHQPNRFLYPRPIDVQMGWRVNPSLRVLHFLIARVGRDFARSMDLMSVARADAVLTNSRWIAQWVKRVYHVKPEVCYPGVDDVFLRGVKEIGPSTESKRPFILSTNRHYPQKRLDWLIGMMPAILRERPSTNLVITGGFTTHTSALLKLRREVGVEPRVIFTGEVDEHELTQLYTAADVYAYPAPEEDFGLGPLEAGACRTPSVVWDHAGPAETVIDGATGYRASPYDLNDFTEKVSRILTDNDLRSRLASNAYNYVKGGFTWKKHVDKLEKILNL